MMIAQTILVLFSLVHYVDAAIVVNIPTATTITSGNYSCYSGSIVQDTQGVDGLIFSSAPEFQLCAIRQYIKTTTNTTYSYFDGIYATNTYKSVQQQCNGTFSLNSTDVGYGTCTLLPFVLAQEFDLCICAGNSYNVNYISCQAAANTATPSPLQTIFNPNLTTPISCQNTNYSYCANLSPALFDPVACQKYFQTNSVLCYIEYRPSDNTIIFQNSFIVDNYASSLLIDYFLYENNTIQVSDSFVYVDITDSNNVTTIKCYCDTANCNANISSCMTAGLMAATSTSMTNSMNEVTSQTTLQQENSESSIAAVATSASVAANSNSIAVTMMMSTTASTTPTTSASSSTATQSVIKDETGLGSAATAGIACGIILSALVFTVEVVLLKFVFGGTSRASSYAA